MKQSYNPKNEHILVNINGELLPRDQAKVSVFDSLVQGGDGCWEGLRVYQGKIFRLGQHLQRLFHSAKALDFADVPSEQYIREQIHRTLEANEMHDGAHIRLTLSRGEKLTSGMDPRLNQAGHTLIVLAEHKAPVYDKGGLKLITASIRRFPPDCMDPKIHHNNLIQSIMAKIEANYAGADDAMMLDTRGFVAETNATHLFMVEDGVLKTSHCVACPEGVTRSTVLQLCREQDIPHEVTDLSQVEFYRADEVFCTGTMGELAAVTNIDGRTIGSGAIGPMTERLSKLYVELTQKESEAVLA
ncbi:MAG: aminotransferase IV [Planctomycetes bacterium]|nr:aminotransferase IV [Planctomycetota bacterium]